MDQEAVEAHYRRAGLLPDSNAKSPIAEEHLQVMRETPLTDEQLDDPHKQAEVVRQALYDAKVTKEGEVLAPPAVRKLILGPKA